MKDPFQCEECLEATPARFKNRTTGLCAWCAYADSRGGYEACVRAYETDLHTGELYHPIHGPPSDHGEAFDEAAAELLVLEEEVSP